MAALRRVRAWHGSTTLTVGRVLLLLPVVARPTRSDPGFGNVLVGAGVVDRDYRGPVGVVLFNHSSSDFKSNTLPSVRTCHRLMVG